MRQDMQHIENNPAARDAEHKLSPAMFFGQKLSNDGVLQFSGMLAYSLLLSVAPLLLGIAGILTVLFFVTGHTQADLAQILTLRLSSVIPASGAKTFAQSIQQNAGTIGVIGVITALIAGAGFFQNVDYVFSIIFRLQQRPFLKNWLMAIGMTLLLIPLVIVMVLATSIPQLLTALLAHTGHNGATSFLGWLLSFAGGVAAAFVLFSAVYVIVPNQRVRLKDVFRGALLAAVLLEIYTLLFPLYAGHFLSNKNYGASMGFALVLIVFFYYFAVILLIGAEFNSWLQGQRDLRGTLPEILYKIEEHGAAVRPDQPASQGQQLGQRPPADRHTTPANQQNRLVRTTPSHRHKASSR